MMHSPFACHSTRGRVAAGGLAALFLGACAGPSLLEPAERPAPSFASAPAAAGILAELAGDIETRYGAAHSGFRLLDKSREALLWRLALIDSAQSSLDILTYLWYPDVTGNLILERAILAAQRGVRVRLVIDDLMTIGQDQIIADVQNQANVEVRLFNPWHDRSMAGRVGEIIAEMERLNTRMHDKLLIVDGHAAIVGGRNIGDHYYGLNHDYNFRDLDLLAFGALAHDAGAMFDDFWNSDWLASAALLDTAPDTAMAAEAWRVIRQKTHDAPELDAFPREPRDWAGDLRRLAEELHPGTGHLVYDKAAAGGVEQTMIGEMFSLFGSARRELLITNAYIIPGQRAIEFLESLAGRGVDIRMLTNSLASHDVPAVNSHYEPWRDDLLRAGVKLFEMRADPAIRTEIDVPPVVSQFSGLHTKAAVIDATTVFIGSMNLDPRSAEINTEMGAVIASPPLAAELRQIFLRDMQGENAWRVQLDDAGNLQWANSDETVDSQPTRGFLQDVMNTVFKVVPKEQY